MEFIVSDNVPEVMRYLSDVERKVLPLAHAKALTFTAEAVKKAEYEEMLRVFDRPTAYTLNALAIRSATPSSLRAEVFYKTDTQKGTKASNYLTPNVRGGPRLQKRSEIAFQRAGHMGNKGYWVPGKGAPLDAHGNMKGSEIKRILSQTKAGDPWQWRTAKSGRRRRARKGPQYFVPPPGSKLKPGVYKREGRGVLPILLFVSSVNYRRRFDYYGLAERTSRRVFPDKWASSLERELTRLRTPR